MGSFIVLIIVLLFLGQLTPRIDFIQEYYQVDLVTNLQMQLALLSMVLCLLVGLWNKILMFMLLIINMLLITANFNGYINFDFLSEQQNKITTRTNNNHFTVMQYTFDDELDNQIYSIYEKIDLIDKDIIVLFNVNELHKTYLKSLSEGRFSYGLIQKERMPSGMTLISKFPIKSKERNTVLDERGDILEITLLINNEDVKITLMHPPKPNSELNWQRRNLMINTLESIQSRTENISPYSLIVSELYTSVWSPHFISLDDFRSCANELGVYGTWFADSKLKLLGIFGAINTSHCFFSYRFKLSDLETSSVTNSLNNFVSYELTMQNTN